MFKFLQELQNAHQVITRTATSDGSIAGLNDVATKAGTDVGFKNNQIDVNSKTGVDAAEVQDYLEKAKDINDEVDCVGFAVELDDSRLVKLYVNEKDAPAFEEELSTNLGVDKEFDELLVDLSKKYDVVDVIWPDQQDSMNQQSTSPDATTQDNAPSSDFSDQLPAVADVSQTAQPGQMPAPIGQEQAAVQTPVEQDKPQHQKDMDEFDELFGTASPEESSEVEPEGGITPAEGDVAPEAEHKRSHHKKPEGETEESDMPPTEGEAEEPPVEGEHKRSHHKKPEGETEESVEGETPVEGETEDSAPTETVEKADDDISVTIKHPKKKKKQVQESISSEGGKMKDSSIFKSLGLDQTYQLVGATLPHPIQDKILALLGILKVPGNSLTKYTTLSDEITEASKLVIANGKLRSLFNKFFTALVSASADDASGYDVEYRTKLKNVLGKLGVQIDEFGATVSINALVLGATMISNNTDVKLLFNQIEPILMQEPPITDSDTPINENIGVLNRHKELSHDNDDDGMTFGSFVAGDEDEDEGIPDNDTDDYDYPPRDHESFEQSMKDQDSSYREWLPRENQVELLNHYLSGVDIHCSTWKPHDGQSLEDHLAYIKKEHIPAAHQEFGYGEFDDGSYEIIFIHPHAIDLGK